MTYDLKTPRTPKLSGAALKAFVALLENRYSSRLLQTPLSKEFGLQKLREVPLEQPPVSLPIHPPARSMTAAAAQTSRQPIDVGQVSDNRSESHFRPTSAFTLARAYRQGETHPVAVAEKVNAYIEASQTGKQALRAFIVSDPSEILRQAHESKARLEKQQARSLLEGVPVAVKDELDALPYTTSAGTRFLADRQSCSEDATLVARLRAAGAIIIGKTNMQEIGLGVKGANPHWGVCRNPYHPDHHTGGSSSGSAAAVASGICPLAVAADGGGSIRIPAALCGVPGLKATWGRISEHGAVPLCWSVAHAGPIGATIDDVALGYLTMAGPDSKDRWTLEQPLLHLKDYLNQDLRHLRIGIYTPWFKDADKAVVDACDNAVRILMAQGATRHEIEIQQLDLQRVAHAVTIASEMRSGMAPWLDQHRQDFGLETRVNLAIAGFFTATDYVRAQQVRTLAMQTFTQALTDVDVIITPSTGITAPEIHPASLEGGESDLGTLTQLMRFAFAANLTGLPALTVPAGYDRKGLPVGLQIMGRAWQEHLLLRLGRIIEQRTVSMQPVVYHNLLA